MILRPPIVIPINEHPARASKNDGNREIDKAKIRVANIKRSEKNLCGRIIPYFGSQNLADNVDTKPVRDEILKSIAPLS